ncbi:thioesterase [Tenacibaculum sp. SZ-18]|uniref:acyl-CoA thioesterase n=1 Tax=Tenacibaculum sp. SZ-18 TaxID=754423 RepID=UPI000C2CFACC|nr:thioesterase family protein [Tenacibaculum sp. SZ-18]AUC14716.1 thioesterase [Tenacibaculum sp. SZ-18]
MKITHNSIVRVRYGETDQMGVVYHGNYAQYFEIGRTEWLRSLGITYKYMEKTGIILPVISLNCNFKKSAYYDDELTISTILKNNPSVKIEFDYEIKNQYQEIVCTGSTILAFLNGETMRPMRCPEFILEKLKVS